MTRIKDLFGAAEAAPFQNESYSFSVACEAMPCHGDQAFLNKLQRISLIRALRSQPSTGKLRIRFFVAAKIALHSAGATGGTGGSPAPLGGSWLSTK